MSPTALVILIVLFLLTSVVGVVTGSNSLLTVPVMFQFGIDEKVAVATNMFGLVFMSVGGTIPFVRRSRIDYRKTAPLILLTIVGSAIGAALVGIIANQSLKLIVSIAMIVVAVFTLLRREISSDEEQPGRVPQTPAAYALTFGLAIYGGLYSGGYVTLLTAVLVAFFAMGFGEAVAATKLINVFSSGVATAVFIWQRLVDYKLGLILGATMFVGAYVGAHYAAQMNERILRKIFLATVILLALKTLYDLTASFI